MAKRVRGHGGRSKEHEHSFLNTFLAARARPQCPSAAVRRSVGKSACDRVSVAPCGGLLPWRGTDRVCGARACERAYPRLVLPPSLPPSPSFSPTTYVLLLLSSCAVRGRLSVGPSVPMEQKRQTDTALLRSTQVSEVSEQDSRTRTMNGRSDGPPSSLKYIRHRRRCCNSSSFVPDVARIARKKKRAIPSAVVRPSRALSLSLCRACRGHTCLESISTCPYQRSIRRRDASLTRWSLSPLVLMSAFALENLSEMEID